MSLQNRKQLLGLYAQASGLLHKALLEFPKAMWKYKPSPKQWSIHEIIIHITDSEINSYVRCRCFIAEPGKTIMAYDQDAWAINLNYHHQSTEEALGLFTLLRHSSLQLIRELPDNIWLNTISHPENGIMTMDDWLQTYADHIPLHIRQMQQVFESWKKSAAMHD